MLEEIEADDCYRLTVGICKWLGHFPEDLLAEGLAKSVGMISTQ